MTPEPFHTEAERVRSSGDPLAVILYRLGKIEQSMDKMLTAELYVARHEALQARVAELEHEQEESARTLRQAVVGVIVAVATAAVTAGFALT